MFIRGVAIGGAWGVTVLLLLKFTHEMPLPLGSGNVVFFEQSNRKKDANFKIWGATTPYTPLLWTLSYAPAVYIFIIIREDVIQ
jgi:hypothetical protein